jgi:hypothetical protein
MKQISHFLFGLILIAMSCRPDHKQIPPESENWYILKIPEAYADQSVQAVYGDVNKTLIVATLFDVFRTTDQGRNWKRVRIDGNHGIFGFATKKDTLCMLDTKRNLANNPVVYASSPFQYSLDGGLVWQLYRGFSRFNVPLNELKTTSGLTYRINEVFTPVTPTSTDKFFTETTGISVSDGRLLTLPQRHQIKSIYLDANQRLYISSSAAVCGSLSDFSFCGEKNGIIYVSKKLQP